MLRTVIDKLEDVPENQRGAYVRGTDGKYYLDRLEETHPVVAKKNELTTSLATTTADKRRVEGELTQAQQKVLPEGKVAVDAKDSELINKLRPYVGEGKPFRTAEEAAAAVKEYPTLKEQTARHEREGNLAKVAGVMKWDVEQAKLLLADLQLPNLVIKPGKDAQQKDIEVVFAEVPSGNGDNKFVEKPFADFVNETPKLKALLPALTAQPSNGGGTAGGGGAGTFGGPPQIFVPPMLSNTGGGGGGGGTQTSPTAGLLNRSYERPDGKTADKQS